MRFLELKLPKLDPEFELVVVENFELPGAYAKACPDKHIIVVRESVYEGACNGVEKDRFTLCHELGHYILHGSDNVAFAREEKTHQYFEDVEWQANTFAGEVLVSEDIVRIKSVSEIMKLCGVSYSVAKIQKEKFEQKNSHQAALKLGGGCQLVNIASKRTTNMKLGTK